MDNTSKVNTWAIPAAIIVAGILIAGAVFLNGQKSGNIAVNNNDGTPVSGKVNLKPVSSADHVLGDLSKAEVVIVEYSDLECPYCKKFQATLHQAVQEYGDKVAWVYRHFPVHSQAYKEAEASECVAEIGGNDKFFKFIDQIFAVSKTDNNLDPKVLTTTAVGLGIDKTQFENCLNSGKYASLVTQQGQDAVTAGG